MRKLETYVNEKLRVTKNSTIPDLISFLESKTKKEFDSKCERLLEYLKNDSNLPIAELENWKNGIIRLSRKYENTNDTFLWVDYSTGVFYGTYDDVYGIIYSKVNPGIRNYTSHVKGFKDVLLDDKDISASGGVFIITENEVLMEQIDYLIQNAEPRS